MPEFWPDPKYVTCERHPTKVQEFKAARRVFPWCQVHDYPMSDVGTACLIGIQEARDKDPACGGT